MLEVDDALNHRRELRERTRQAHLGDVGHLDREIQDAHRAGPREDRELVGRQEPEGHGPARNEELCTIPNRVSERTMGATSSGAARGTRRGRRGALRGWRTIGWAGIEIGTS